MTEIFDTHAHYDDEAFDEDRETLLKELPGRGIARVVNVGADLETCRRTIELMERYDYIYGAIGVHPCNVGELDETAFAWLRQQCLLEKCVAVGEIGLDYHWEEPTREMQRKWFRRQIGLAREVQKPLIIHSRDAAQETAEILRDERAQDAGGVIHCFSYTKEMAKTFLDMGFYIGIGGVLTFRNAKKLKEAAEYIPLDRIVLETDCPYLAPEPYRGKRNTSLNIPYVISALAQIKGVDEETVRRAAWENAHRMLYIFKNFLQGSL